MVLVNAAAGSSEKWWSERQLVVIDSALGDAREGRPSTVLVEGDPGMGKTTFLDEMVQRATDFVTVDAEGVEGSATPFAVFEQWGLSVAADTSPFVAAQRLSERLDRVRQNGPTLLRLDDLQWADPESVEALVWLVRRAQGDRLSVVIGTRPLSSGQHVTWQQLARSSSRVAAIRLSGLSEDAATEMIRRHRPSLSDEVCHQLWTHCGGNPLYLSALLAEHDLGEVMRMRVLPAPSQFEQLTTARLADLGDDEVSVVRAAAVLGNGWISMPKLVSTADVPDVVNAIGEAERAGLLQVRSLDGALRVRPAHALVRSAVYYATPLSERRALHLRAAEVADSLEQQFDHRVQAAVAFDDRLSDDLRKQAEVFHLERSYRLAGRLLNWAAQLTADRRLGEQLRLDALFEQLLAGQLDAVSHELTRLPPDADPGRVQLLRGLVALRAIRPSDALRALTRAVELLEDDSDPRSRSRAFILLAAAHVRIGSSAETLMGDLELARQSGPTDPALRYYEVFAEAVVSLRKLSTADLLRELSFLRSTAAEVPVGQIDALASRGHLRVYEGLVPEAITDLREVYQRAVGGDAVAGVAEVADGLLLSALAGGHWLHGEWERARVAFSLVEELAPNMAVLPHIWQVVLPAATGDVAEANRRLNEAVEALEREPYPEVVDVFLFAKVTLAHAVGDDNERATLLGEFRAQWPNSLTGYPASVWYLAAAQAAIWATEVELADRWIGHLEGPQALARWAPAAALWLRGMQAFQVGRRVEALGLLRAAVEAPCVDVPFYRAHILTDHARLAQECGLTDEGTTSRNEAQRIYRRLGALPYLDRRPDVDRTGAADTRHAGMRVQFGLSEREEGVATLVANGMSYAQVSRELFISRSTVGFHLGNIYAKTGVRSRQELHDLVRSMARSA